MTKMIIDISDNMQEMCKWHKEGICDLTNIEVDILAEAVRNGTPLPKGHWVGTEYDGYADGNPVYDTWECSECGWEHNGEDDTLTYYCPNCGARMVSE